MAEDITNAATISQSSALEPGDFVFRRRCKRKTTAMHARAINIAFVAIIARDAEVVMLDSRKILLQSKGRLIEEICQSERIVGRGDTSAPCHTVPSIATLLFTNPQSKIHNPVEENISKLQNPAIVSQCSHAPSAR